jgi:hypothetical protein
MPLNAERGAGAQRARGPIGRSKPPCVLHVPARRLLQAGRAGPFSKLRPAARPHETGKGTPLLYVSVTGRLSGSSASRLEMYGKTCQSLRSVQIDAA